MKRITHHWYYIILLTGVAAAAFIFFHMGGIRTWRSFELADWAVLWLGLVGVKFIIRIWREFKQL